MNCKRARRMLVVYANEALWVEDSRLIQEHVAGCDSCRRELDELRKVLRLIDDVKVEYPPASVWENFLPDLHRRIEGEAALAFKKRQKRHLSLLPGWVASAAAVMLVLLASVMLRYYYSAGSLRPKRSGNIEVVEDGSPSMIVEDSTESVLVAGIISKVLITETESEELKKLKSFIQSESLPLPHYYDDLLIDMSGDVGSTEDNGGVIQFLLESDFAEFDENPMVESDDGEFETM